MMALMPSSKLTGSYYAMIVQCRITLQLEAPALFLCILDGALRDRPLHTSALLPKNAQGRIS
jgi:hypothetical protein